MNKKYIITFLVVILGASACTDLDVKPKSSATGDVIFNNSQAYLLVLAVFCHYGNGVITQRKRLCIE